MDISTDYPARVAAVVKDAMAATKITTFSLAKLSGVPRQTLDRRLLGNAPGFNASELAAIAPHLGVKVSHIYLAAEASAA